MALLVNQEITSQTKGTLSSFYIKLEEFNIHKIEGVVYCVCGHYTDSSEALKNSINYKTFFDNENGGSVLISDSNIAYDKSLLIGGEIYFNGNLISFPNYYKFDITRPVQVQEDVYENIESEEQVPYYDFDAQGNVIELTRTMNVTRSIKTGTVTLDRNQIDFNLLTSNPYNWLYSQLKKEYENIFGVGNVLDV
jgi:hypothetical protein